MFLCFLLLATILLYHSFIHCRILKLHCMNILQYRILLIHKITHGSYLQVTELYEFWQMTLHSNHINECSKKIHLQEFDENIFQTSESLSCCAYGTLFCNFFQNNLVLVLFIVLLSLIYNSKRKILWLIYMQYISNPVLKISATRYPLLSSDSKMWRWRILIRSFCLNSCQ